MIVAPWALLLVVGLACAPQSASQLPAAVSPRTRLVVLVVIDGLPSWSFADKAAASTAGVARVLREGVVYRAATYPYAATYTAVGHAALVTGAPPAATGILSNRWYDRDAGRVIEAVEDPARPIQVLEPSPGAPPRADGASPGRLLVEGIGDVLVRATQGRARVVTVSLKARAAILMGGRQPTAAVFYDPAQAAFTTTAPAPAWLRSLAHARPIAPRIAGYTWQLSDPVRLAHETGLFDDAPGETGLFGLGPTFPHRPSAAPDPAEAIEVTPLADELVLEVVQAAIRAEGLGQDGVADLLCVSFSTHDLIGHGWGDESWESREQFASLDHVLGRLLETLDAEVGRDAWALVLTSDHGATRVVEQRGGAAVRLDADRLHEVIVAAAREAAGEGAWIADTREQLVYLTPAARALPAAGRGALLDAVVAALRGVDGVGFALRTDRFAAGCAGLDGLDALVCHSTHPTRSGEIYYGPRAGSVVMRRPFEATTHGTANPDDRAVPLVVLEPGRAPGVVHEAVSTLRVAPTLARLLGVPAPAAAIEAPL